MNPHERLEEEYAVFCKKKYCVAVNSGTAALHVALVALGIGKGDEVIVPDFTMAACGFAVAYTGAKVVTVDCNDHLLIDPVLIEAKITKKTKAIMAVHIYGRVCNMTEINRIAKAHDLFVIEDAAEAQGARGLGRADLSCYSFFKNKIIHGEEGGAVCTDDEELYKSMKDLKNMAFGKEHDYYHERIGFNYRLPDSQAEMILKSLHSFGDSIHKRRMIESWYQDYCAYSSPFGKRLAVWVYDIISPHVHPLGRHFFKPLSTMPMFKQDVGPKALQYSKFGSYLPVDPNMTEQDVIKICQSL